MVGAGFEADPGGGAVQVGAGGVCRGQRGGFGVRSAGLLGRAAGQRAPVGGSDDAADARIGLAQADGGLGQCQGFVETASV